MTSCPRNPRRLPGIDPDEWSIQTGTNSTMSGIRGAGRTLDIWMGKGGRVIEAAITRFSLRLAPRPTVLFERLVAPYDLHFYPCDLCTAMLLSSGSTQVLMRPANMFFPIGRQYYSPDFEGGWRHALNCFRGLTHKVDCPSCRQKCFSALSARPTFEQDVQKLVDAFVSVPDVETQNVALIYIYVLALYNPDFHKFLVIRGFGAFLHRLLDLILEGGADSRQSQWPMITELIYLLERGIVNVSNAGLSSESFGTLTEVSEFNYSPDGQLGFNRPLQSLAFMFLEYPYIPTWESTMYKLATSPAPCAALLLEWIDRIWQPAAQLSSPFSSFLCCCTLEYVYNAFYAWKPDPSEGDLRLACVERLFLAEVPYDVAVDHAELFSGQIDQIWWFPRLSDDMSARSFLNVPGQLKGDQHNPIRAQRKFRGPSDTLKRWIEEIVGVLESARANLQV